MTKTSLRGLATFCGMSTSTLGRLRDEGVITPDRRVQYAIEEAVGRMLHHYSYRSMCFAAMLARHRIFCEAEGDRLPPWDWRKQGA